MTKQIKQIRIGVTYADESTVDEFFSSFEEADAFLNAEWTEAIEEDSKADLVKE